MIKDLEAKRAKQVIAGCTETRLLLRGSELSKLDLITLVDLIVGRVVQRAKTEG